MEPLSPIGCEGNIPSDSEHRRCLVPPVPSNFQKIDLRVMLRSILELFSASYGLPRVIIRRRSEFSTSDTLLSRDLLELEFLTSNGILQTATSRAEKH